MKRKIRLTESKLNRIITEAVNKIITESDRKAKYIRNRNTEPYIGNDKWIMKPRYYDDSLSGRQKEMQFLDTNTRFRETRKFLNILIDSPVVSPEVRKAACTLLTRDWGSLVDAAMNHLRRHDYRYKDSEFDTNRARNYIEDKRKFNAWKLAHADKIKGKSDEEIRKMYYEYYQ